MQSHVNDGQGKLYFVSFVYNGVFPNRKYPFFKERKELLCRRIEQMTVIFLRDMLSFSAEIWKRAV